MSETFFMSNMSPMAPSFNRGIWSRLESWVRGTALSEGDLHIVTGPILNKSCGLISGSITVPCSFYKIVFKDGETPKAIGFILLNSGSTSSITDFAVTIDEIESMTGIDFFPQLNDNTENRIESTLDFNSWGL
jgi:endonuclease G